MSLKQLFQNEFDKKIFKKLNKGGKKSIKNEIENLPLHDTGRIIHYVKRREKLLKLPKNPPINQRNFLICL